MGWTNVGNIKGPQGNVGPQGDTGPAGGAPPWAGNLHVAWGDGDPAMRECIWSFQNTVVSVAGPTPTGIGATVGRLVRFKFDTAITVNRLRLFGLASVSSLYTLAIYSGWAAGASRVLNIDPLNVVAGWQSFTTGLPITIPANTWYALGIGAKATGTTAGFRTMAAPIATVLNGNAAQPGNLESHIRAKFAQVTLVAGAWPATLPALAAPAFAAGSTGTLPLAFLDNNAAA